MNDTGEIWGCSRYDSCKGTRPGNYSLIEQIERLETQNEHLEKRYTNSSDALQKILAEAQKEISATGSMQEITDQLALIKILASEAL